MAKKRLILQVQDQTKMKHGHTGWSFQLTGSKQPPTGRAEEPPNQQQHTEQILAFSSSRVCLRFQPCAVCALSQWPSPPGNITQLQTTSQLLFPLLHRQDGPQIENSLDWTQV